jgi:hypothetical protein
MYFENNDAKKWSTKPSNKVKKGKVSVGDLYDDGIKRTKIDPYKPSKFRKKINIRDIQMEDDA